MNHFEEAEAIEALLKRERDEFPMEEIARLIGMNDQQRQEAVQLEPRVLSALIRMARRTLHGRWRSADTPPPSGEIVMGHISGRGGGFQSAFYSEGEWWTHDFLDDGSRWGSITRRKVRVLEWRHLEGSAAEPWHNRSYLYLSELEQEQD